MNDADKYWVAFFILYDLIKNAKPDLTHEEIVALVEKKLEKEN
jgi:hypothetical protein